MNILLSQPFPPADMGGVTTFVTRLQEGLNDRGHRALLLESADTLAPTRDTRNPLAYRVYLRSMVVKGAYLKAFVAFWSYLPLSLYHLWTFLRDQRIEVVHLHFPTPGALYFAILRLVSPWRLMVTLHGSDVYALPRRTWWYRALLGVVLSQVDFVAAGTDHLIQALRTSYPRIRIRCRVIPNGSPTLRGESASVSVGVPEDFALAVGSLIPRKAYDVLLRAVALVRDAGQKLDLVIVGAGPEAARLAALATELNLDDRVVFAGEQRHVAPFYSKARFFVHPAREEAQGLVLVEAMSSKKAVIATRVLGIPELIHDGETGLLVEPDDPQSLATALMRLATDTELRDTLAQGGYECITRRHTWDHFMAGYLDAYDSVGGSAATIGPRLRNLVFAVSQCGRQPK